MRELGTGQKRTQWSLVSGKSLDVIVFAQKCVCDKVTHTYLGKALHVLLSCLWW